MTDRLIASEILAENARRFEPMMRLQRLLPTIARIGEEMGARTPGWQDLGRWMWIVEDGFARITIRTPDNVKSHDRIALYVGRDFRAELAPDADEATVESTIREFYAALIKETA